MEHSGGETICQCLFCHLFIGSANKPLYVKALYSNKVEVLSVCSKYFIPKLLPIDEFKNLDISKSFTPFCSECIKGIKELIEMTQSLIKLQRSIQEFVDSFSNDVLNRRHKRTKKKLQCQNLNTKPNSGSNESKTGTPNFQLKDLRVCLERVDGIKRIKTTVVNVETPTLQLNYGNGIVDTSPQTGHKDVFDLEDYESGYDYHLENNVSENEEDTLNTRIHSKPANTQKLNNFALKEVFVSLERIDGTKANDCIGNCSIATSSSIKLPTTNIAEEHTTGEDDCNHDLSVSNIERSSKHKINDLFVTIPTENLKHVTVQLDDHGLQESTSYYSELAEIDNVEIEEKFDIKEFFMADPLSLPDEVYIREMKVDISEKRKTDFIIENNQIVDGWNAETSDSSEDDNMFEEEDPLALESDEEISAFTGRKKRKAAINAKSKILSFKEKDGSDSEGISGEEYNHYDESLDMEAEEMEDPVSVNKSVRSIKTCEKCGMKDWNSKLEKKYHLKGKNCVASCIEITQCNECEESFASQYDLEIHKMSHTSEIPFECPFCHDKYLTSNDYEQHVRESSCPSHPDAEKYEELECEICGKTFKANYLLLQHRSGHSKGRKCEICGKRVHKYDHFLMHTQEIPFVCDICCKPMFTFKDFKGHRMSHIAVDIFSADLKNQKIESRAKSSIHCDKCNKTSWTTKLEKVYHFKGKNCVKDLTGTIKCITCQESFTSQYDLEIHEMSHTNEIPYECPFCHDKYLNALDYGQHMRDSSCLYKEHNGKLECDKCGKKCRAKYLLLSHQTRHDKLRKCVVCGIRSHMLDHFIAHTNEIALVCDICKRPMTRFRDFKSHRLSHSGVDSNSTNFQTRILHNHIIDSEVTRFRRKLRRKATLKAKSNILDFTKNDKEECSPSSGDDSNYEESASENTDTEEAEKRHSDKGMNKRFKYIAKCDKCNTKAWTTTLEKIYHLKGKDCENNLEETHQCMTCKESFKCQYDLEIHAMSHTIEIPFECPFCHDKYLTSNDYEQHMRESACLYSGNIETFECDQCDKVFRAKYMLMSHSANHRKQKCEVCGIKATKADHYLMHTDEMALVCDICRKPLDKFAHYKPHRLTHVGVQNLIDSENEVPASSSDLVKDHFDLIVAQMDPHAREDVAFLLNRKEAEILYDCPVCHSKFYCNTEYMAHVRKSDCPIISGTDNQKSFKCKDCPKIFKAKFLLLYHKAMNHNNGICSICNHVKKDYDHYLTHTDEVACVCDICGMPQARFRHLIRHRLTHLGRIHWDHATTTTSTTNFEIPLECQTCHQKFHAETAFIAHIRTSPCPANLNDAPKSFQCDKCDEKFKAEYLLLRHRALEHQSGKCEVCNEILDASCYDHFVEHTGEYSCYCDICRRPFKKAHTLWGHRLTHVGNQNRYKCNMGNCSKGFGTHQKLKIHQDRHRNLANQGICDICGNTFKSSYAVKIHRLTHKGENGLYQCNFKDCSKEFKHPLSLKYHFTWHNNLEIGETLTCDICQKKYAHPRAFLKHMELHSDRDKMFLCNVCGKALTSKARLKLHIQTHKDTREKFPCTICDMQLASRDCLRRHHRSIHLKVGKYPCKICGRPFEYPCMVDDHIRVAHTNEKPFACETCGRRFHAKRYLARHKKCLNCTPNDLSETEVAGKNKTTSDQGNQGSSTVGIRRRDSKDEKECDKCGKTFKTQKYLWKHRKTHFEELSCSVCGKAFSWKQNLKRHEKLCSSKSGKATSLSSKKVIKTNKTPAKKKKPVESESSNSEQEYSDDSS